MINTMYVFSMEETMAKNICIVLVIGGLIFFAGIACNNDKTELAWINENDLSESINEIIWADNDQVWSKSNGYSYGEKTEAKEVSKLNGSVYAGLWDNNSNEWLPCPVIGINGNPQGSLSLNEGSSEVYRITRIDDKR